MKFEGTLFFTVNGFDARIKVKHGLVTWDLEHRAMSHNGGTLSLCGNVEAESIQEAETAALAAIRDWAMHVHASTLRSLDK